MTSTNTTLCCPHPPPVVQETRLSEFHLSVSHSLALLGVAHEVEHMTADLFSVDIALQGPTGE